MPTQLEEIERGVAPLASDEVLDLAEVYQCQGIWPEPRDWRVSTDLIHGSPALSVAQPLATKPPSAHNVTSADNVTPAHNVTSAQTPSGVYGLDRLMAEVLGSRAAVDPTAVVVRTLALIESLGAEIDFPVIGLSATNTVVESIAAVLDVSPQAVVEARREAAVHRRGAIATLAHELQFHVAVPAIGLLIAEGPGGGLFLRARQPRNHLVPPLSLDGEDHRPAPARRPCRAAATLGAFSSGTDEIDLVSSTLRIQL